MQLPAILYGTHAEVLKRCRKVLTRFLREPQPLIEVIEAEGMVDTADHPGLLILARPSSYVMQDVHFHCYALLPLLSPAENRSLGPIGEPREQEVLTVLLDRPWSLLCLFDFNNMNYWFTQGAEPYYARYVGAMLRSWDVLDREGWRYSLGSTGGERLWDAALTLRQALARLAVPTVAMGWQQPLPSGGLPALAVEADPAVASELIAVAAVMLAREEDTSTHAATELSLYREVPPTGAPPVWASDELAAAMQANDAAAVRCLIDAGEPATVLDSETCRTPIVWAASNGHADLVGLLLDHGAALEDRADEGESPLMLAARGGHRATVQLLLDRGADVHYVTEKGWDAVEFAELRAHEDVARVIRHARARTDRAIRMSVAMVAAMRENDPGAVRELVAAGESVQALNMESLQRPLHWAAEQGHTDLVLFLLDHGAGVDDRSDGGETPLMRASWMGHGQIVQLLLARGADPYAVCDRDWEPVDYAKARNHTEVAAMIEEALATLE